MGPAACYCADSSPKGGGAKAIQKGLALSGQSYTKTC